MPGTILELRDSRTFTVDQTGGKAQFKYFITGESDEQTAYELVLATSPATWYEFVRDTIDMNERPGLNQWFPVVSYSVPVGQPSNPLPSGNAASDPAPGPGGGTPPSGSDALVGVSFSIALENQHVTKSLETISRTGAGAATAPDYKGLIGVSISGVEGVDIGVPVTTITRRVTVPYLSAEYFKNLIYMIGKTNAEPYWLFSYEEALLSGINGQDKGGGGFEMNIEFKYQKTKTDILIRSNDDGKGITVPEKKGWNYLWVSYVKEKDTTAGVIVDRPIAAYVERVYDTVGFEWLGV